MNLGAMQAQLNQNLRASKTKDRLRQKLAQRQAMAQAQAEAAATSTPVENTAYVPQQGVIREAGDGNDLVYKGYEIAERTPRTQKPDKKNRKKRKKKKSN